MIPYHYIISYESNIITHALLGKRILLQTIESDKGKCIIK